MGIKTITIYGMRHIRKRQKFYTYSEISKLTGTAKHNIVNWKTKFPNYFSGYTKMNQHDLEFILKLNNLVNIEGYQLWKAFEIIDEEIKNNLTNTFNSV